MTSPISILTPEYGFGGGFVAPVFPQTGNPRNYYSCPNQITKEFDMTMVFWPGIYTDPSYNPQKSFPRVTTPDVDWWRFMLDTEPTGMDSDAATEPFLYEDVPALASDIGNFLSNSYFDPRIPWLPRPFTSYSLHRSFYPTVGDFWSAHNSSAMKCLMWYYWNEYHDMFPPGDVGGTSGDFNYQEALQVILKDFPVRWYWEEQRVSVGSGNVVSYFDKLLPYPFMESVTTIPSKAPYTTGNPPELWYAIERYDFYNAFLNAENAVPYNPQTLRNVNESWMTFFEHLIPSDNWSFSNGNVGTVEEGNVSFNIQSNPSGVAGIGFGAGQAIVASDASVIPIKWLQETIKHAQSGWDVLLHNPKTNRIHPSFPCVDNGTNGFSWGNRFYGQSGSTPSVGQIYGGGSLLPFVTSEDSPIRSLYYGDIIGWELGQTFINYGNPITGVWGYGSEYLGDNQNFNVPIPAVKPEISFQLIDLIHRPTGWVNDVGIPTGTTLVSGIPLHSGAGPFCESIHQINNVMPLFYNVFGKKTADATTYTSSYDYDIVDAGLIFNIGENGAGPGGSDLSGINETYTQSYSFPNIDFVMGAIHFGTVLQPTGLRIKMTATASPASGLGVAKYVTREVTTYNVYSDGGSGPLVFASSYYGGLDSKTTDFVWNFSPVGAFNIYLRDDYDRFNPTAFNYSAQNYQIPYYQGLTTTGPINFTFPNNIDLEIPAYQGLEHIGSASGSNPMVNNFLKRFMGVDESGNGNQRWSGPDQFGYSCGMMLSIRTGWLYQATGVLDLCTNVNSGIWYGSGLFFNPQIMGPYGQYTISGTYQTSQQGVALTEWSMSQVPDLKMDMTLNINDIDVPLSDFGGGWKMGPSPFVVNTGNGFPTTIVASLPVHFKAC